MPLTLKLTLIPTLIFAAIIALIRSQPYNDSELRAFLTPPQGCSAPCFMGIRPGVTTVDEAIALLESHECVEKVRDLGGQITWDWRKGCPESFNGFLKYDGVVFLIYVAAPVTIGETWLELGHPEEIYLDYGSVFFDYRNIYIGMYTNGAVQVRAALPCPMRLGFLWQTKTWIQFVDEEYMDSISPKNYEWPFRWSRNLEDCRV